MTAPTHSIIRAHKPDGSRLAVAFSLPMDDEGWERLTLLAGIDGLSEATWTGTPSTDRSVR